MNNISDPRFPAEWEPQSAVLLTWPHSGTDWEPNLAAVTKTYLEIAKQILKHENLIISCEDASQLKAIEQALLTHVTKPFTLKLYQVPANDTWARDHGPVGIYRNHKLELIDYQFNAWGGKFAFEKDNLISKCLYDLGGLTCNKFIQSELILEGGSIETNGKGTLLTTRECLLSTTRNKNCSESEVENQLRTDLGINHFLWLSHGYLKGDDTDSHIDTLARFCDENTICYTQCTNPDDEHYGALKNMESELKAFRSIEGTPYRLIPLPLPSPCFFDGERLPATYANFLIINNAVLFPVYDIFEDRLALEKIKKCFPDHETIPINCNELIKQHGSLHCITMQIPKPDEN